MPQAILFLLGIVSCQQWPTLAPPWLAFSALLTALVLLCRRGRHWQWPAFWLLGAAYLSLYAHHRLAASLPRSEVGVAHTVTGVVSRLQKRTETGQRLVFQIDAGQFSAQDMHRVLPVRLTWRGAPALLPGQRWRLRVKLYPPDHFHNPGSFDYEAWLFRHGFRARGYVLSEALNEPLPRRLSSLRWWPERWRQLGVRALEQSLSGYQHRGSLMALAMGERRHLQEAHWSLLARTGTSHLLAISGLHIAMVAGLVIALAGGLWRLLVRRRRVRRDRWVLSSALLAAGIYAWLAGFALSTQRALWMLLAWVLAQWRRRYIRPVQVLALALWWVLLWDPLSVMDRGFWLSFGAVVWILYSRWWWQHSAWRQGFWMSVCLALGMLPLTLYWFGMAHGLSPLINALAIPYVGLLVLPLVLLSLLLEVVAPSIAAWGWALSDQLLTVFYAALEELSREDGWLLQLSPSLASLLAATLGVAVLLSAGSWRSKWLGLLLLGALWWPQRPDAVLSEQVRLSVLDVGHGLAVLIETPEGHVLYDTGARFSRQLDAGTHIISPYLRTRGIEQLHTVVVSHPDRDHSGGLEGVLEQHRVARVVAGRPRDATQQPCAETPAWQLGSARFQLWQWNNRSASDNNSSCVLILRVGSTTVLLPGDIEREAEQALVEAGLSRVDLLLSPHHGSASSSTPAFLDAVGQPQVVISAARHSRYRLPAASVLARYRARGLEVYQTQWAGALWWEIAPDGRLQGPESAQKSHRKYWHSNF